MKNAHQLGTSHIVFVMGGLILPFTHLKFTCHPLHISASSEPLRRYLALDGLVIQIYTETQQPPPLTCFPHHEQLNSINSNAGHTVKSLFGRAALPRRLCLRTAAAPAWEPRPRSPAPRGPASQVMSPGGCLPIACLHSGGHLK